MKILAVTQARIGSTRFPEKILKEINGESLLEMHLKRIKKSNLISKYKIATTTEPGVEKIISIAEKFGIEVFQGSIDNVLKRFYYAALPEEPDWIVRLTSDCPLIDAVEVDRVIKHTVDKNYDYVSNTMRPTFPDGLDVEVFKYSCIETAWREAKLPSDREHVTPYIWKNSTYMGGNLFNSDCVINNEDYSNIRLTVDTYEDFLVIKEIVSILDSNRPWEEYVQVLKENPNIINLNMHHARNEGYKKSLIEDGDS